MASAVFNHLNTSDCRYVTLSDESKPHIELKNNEITKPESPRSVTFSVIDPCFLAFVHRLQYSELLGVPLKVTDCLSNRHDITTLPARYYQTTKRI